MNTPNAFLLLAALGFASAAIANESKSTDLFRAGEGGYAMYRIPALVVTPQQTLLAACEARLLGRGDWDHVDIFMRRSVDGGLTWEPARELVGQKDLPADLKRNPAAIAAGLGRDGVFTINNPTWIADADTGETHLLFCAEYSRAFIITTHDGGATFSALREITDAFRTFASRDDYTFRVIAIGPGHGIRLSSGRLVAPVWLSTGEGGHAHRPSACATIYSDDHGTSWHAGEIVARHPRPLLNPSECAIVEAAPGKVMLNIRSESMRNRRAIAWSTNGATGWTEPGFAEPLWEPVCMAAMERIDSAQPDASPVLLFSNPASLDKSPRAPAESASRVRQNLTLRASLDGGRTWPIAHVIAAGPSAYSDLATDAATRTIYCFHETGDAGPYEKLAVVRLEADDLLRGSP